MSKCVVRMEMPSGCDKCPFMWGNCIIDEKDECYGRVHYNDVVVRISGNKYSVRKDRPSWCPILCELPEKHGRLVDADEIMQAIDEDIELDSRGLDDMYITGRVRERLRMDKGYKKGFKEYMRKRPTIVPAERSEE